MAQAIRAVERVCFDLMLLSETIQTEVCSHNRLGYDVICSAARKSISVGIQGGVGLVSLDCPNRWGIESIVFHEPNLVSYKTLSKVSDMESV